MLHNELNDYISGIDKACLTLTNCHFEKYDEEIISPDRANLRIRVRFLNGYLIEINEVISTVMPSIPDFVAEVNEYFRSTK